MKSIVGCHKKPEIKAVPVENNNRISDEDVNHSCFRFISDKYPTLNYQVKVVIVCVNQETGWVKNGYLAFDKHKSKRNHHCAHFASPEP